MEHRANIFWCTGLSGAGKSTLVEYTKNILVEQGHSALILDGDTVREKYKVKLGFGREDVKKNNFLFIITLNGICPKKGMNSFIYNVRIIIQ